jgi:hypothetical protein
MHAYNSTPVEVNKITTLVCVQAPITGLVDFREPVLLGCLKIAEMVGMPGKIQTMKMVYPLAASARHAICLFCQDYSSGQRHANQNYNRSQNLLKFPFVVFTDVSYVVKISP